MTKCKWVRCRNRILGYKTIRDPVDKEDSLLVCRSGVVWKHSYTHYMFYITGVRVAKYFNRGIRRNEGTIVKLPLKQAQEMVKLMGPLLTYASQIKWVEKY